MEPKKRELLTPDKAAHVLDDLTEKIEAVEKEVSAALNDYQFPQHSVPQAFRGRYLLTQAAQMLTVAAELVDR